MKLNSLGFSMGLCRYMWVRVPPPAPPRRSKLYIACSDFLCLWQKSQSALMPLLLLSKSKPLRWASIWIHLTETADSVSPLVPRRSKLHIACSDFLCPGQKSQSALIPLLLLSKSNPLRWASIWASLMRSINSVSPLVPRRSKLHIACSVFLCLRQKNVIRPLSCSPLPNRPPAPGINFF